MGIWDSFRRFSSMGRSAANPVKSARKHRRATRPSRARELRLEQFEQRMLLSINPLLVGNDLQAITLGATEMLLLREAESPNDGISKVPLNVNAADTTNTDQIKVGGLSGLDLEGSGYTVGVWDGGLVRASHQEFGGRVTPVDTGPTTDHATHVAGTIAAAGVMPGAEGMGTQLQVLSYDWNNDYAELAAAAAAVPDPIVASNHSYGYPAGWEVYSLPNPLFPGLTTTSGWVDAWLGDRYLYSVEDPNFGKYDSEAATLDQVLYNNPMVVSVWSAGNDGNDQFLNVSLDDNYVSFFSQDPGGIGWTAPGFYLVSSTGAFPPPPGDGNGGTGFDTVGYMQTAKNSLVVGSVEDITADPYTAAAIVASSFSSFGPTDDGRIKPDVMGNGADLFSASNVSDTDYYVSQGTSMSAPNVAGTAALLVEHFENQFSTLPSSAMTKAVLIHTASDGGNIGPDYSYGWGLVDAAAAAEFIYSAAAGAPTDRVVEGTYAGSEWTTTFAFGGVGPLKATLVWTDPVGQPQPAGLDNATPVLVNDLDLWLTGPSGTHLPWTLNPANPSAPAVRTAANHVDNVEQVVIDLPASGVYTIHVGATGAVPSQSFSLLISDASPVITGGPELVEVITNAGSKLRDGDVLHIGPRELLFRFSTDQIIDPLSLDGIQIVRSVDGVFGNGDDAVVPFGWSRIGDYENEVIVRFRETLPDDRYQIVLVGEANYQGPSGAVVGPLQNNQGLPFHGGENEVHEFKLDLGSKVVAVVPMPVVVASIDFRTVAASQIRDGDTFVVSDGVNTVTFEFDDVWLDPPGSPPGTGGGNGVQGDNVRILFNKLTQSAADVAQAIRNRFYQASDPVVPDKLPGITGVTATGDVVKITADTAGGYTAIFKPGRTKFVVSGQSHVQKRDTIEVYFNADSPLDPIQAQKADFYSLLYTNGTADPSDDMEYKPPVVGGVTYDPAANKVSLKFLGGDLAALTTGTGVYRLRIGNDYQPVVTKHMSEQTTEAGQSFYTNQTLAGSDFGAIAGPHSLILSASIDAQPFRLEFPGAVDEPGHRDLPPMTNTTGNPMIEDHYLIDGSNTDASDGITTLYYNFGPVIGYEASGQPIPNIITEAQKERAREIFDLYSYYLGVQFRETANQGLLVATGDFRAIGMTSAPGGILGVQTTVSGVGPIALMDYKDFDTDPGFFGGGWFRTAIHEIGHWLEYGHTYDLPPYTTMGSLPGAGEITYPGNHDIVHGQHMYRPDSIDVDLYKFTLPAAGTFSAETLAERMNNSSDLDTLLTLYHEYQIERPDGLVVTKYEVVSRNDDYYSKDSYVEMYLGAGTYYIGVSASGNSAYDPQLDDTGVGGTTEGIYDLRLNFTPGGVDPEDPATFQWNGNPATQTAPHLIDANLTYFDGDADGVPGGVYNYWFNVQTAADTIFVDKLAPSAGADGSLAHPYNEIDVAFSQAQAGDIVRILGNNYQDDNPAVPATYLNNHAYHIGAGLADGTTMRVPQGVTVMIDAGAMLKFRQMNIDVGSLAEDEDRSGAALQVLGIPGRPVFFTSYKDETMGVDLNPLVNTTPARGDWGGLVFHNDYDYEFLKNYSVASAADLNDLRRIDEIDGIFLNYVNNADLRFGGGLVNIDGNVSSYAPIHLIEARPAITFNTITNSKGAAISADPDSFADDKFQSWDFSRRLEVPPNDPLPAGSPFTADYERIGPDVHGNRIVNNAINGMFVRADTILDPVTLLAVPEKVDQTTRFDDWDVVHVIPQNLIIEGKAGGPILEPQTTNVALSDGNHLHVPSVGDPAIQDGETFTLFDGTTKIIFEFDSTPGGSIVPGHVRIPFGQALGITTARDIATSIKNVINNTARDVLGLGVTATVGGPVTDPNIGIVSLRHMTPVLETHGFAKWNYFGSYLEAAGTYKPRLDSRLVVDPAVIVKMQDARIETEPGAQFIAEGRVGASEGAPGSQVIFTSLVDSRYGTGGTFNTAEVTQGTVAQPGDWIGFYFGPMSEGSINNAVIAYAGGETANGQFKFDPVEIRQAKVRIANSRFENNAANSDGDREGRGTVDLATIFVRGAQPVIVSNAFFNNSGPIINIDVNSLNADGVQDWGRSTGSVRRFSEYDDNVGPLVRDFRMTQTSANPNNQIHGMNVRAGTLTTASVWDDVDIVHLVRGEIRVDNYHHGGGLRLQSTSEASLVVKLGGASAGFTAAGNPGEVDDRVGGAVQILGHPQYPVVLTSIGDASVGAGRTLDGWVQQDTFNDGGSAGGGTGGGPVTPSSELLFTGTHTYDFLPGDGALTIQVDVYNNFFGDFNKYRWEYTVTNNSYDPTPGSTNGFSGFELALPASVPDLQDIYFPSGEPWEVNSYSGQPVEWDLKNSLGQGVMPGETGVFGFSSLPRLVTNSTGYYHTWQSDVQAFITMWSVTPGELGPECPDVLAPAQEPPPPPAPTGQAGDWRGIIFDSYSHDRNMPVVLEREPAYGVEGDLNSLTSNDAQFLGRLAPYEKAGDDNLRLGFEIHGNIRSDAPADVDLYRFRATPGTEIWIDVDRSTYALDTVIELVSSTGQVWALSDNSFDEEATPGLLQSQAPGSTTKVYTMDRDNWLDGARLLRPRAEHAGHRQSGRRLCRRGVAGVQGQRRHRRSGHALGQCVGRHQPAEPGRHDRRGRQRRPQSRKRHRPRAAGQPPRRHAVLEGDARRHQRRVRPRRDAAGADGQHFGRLRVPDPAPREAGGARLGRPVRRHPLRHQRHRGSWFPRPLAALGRDRRGGGRQQ